jgi:hypothetical protein
MPAPRISEDWRFRRPVRWLDEEIYAWIDYEQGREDNLYKRGLAAAKTAGRMITDEELISIQEAIDLE